MMPIANTQKITHYTSLRILISDSDKPLLQKTKGFYELSKNISQVESRRGHSILHGLEASTTIIGQDSNKFSSIIKTNLT